MTKTIVELLEGLPVNDVVYMTNSAKVETPYIAYYGDGADTMQADNHNYFRENTYLVQYYFDKKDEELERKIEERFDENHLVWTKSPDVYIPEDKINMIYYMI